MFKKLLDLFLSRERKIEFAIGEFNLVYKQLTKSQEQALKLIEEEYQKDIHSAEQLGEEERNIELLAAQHKYNEYKNRIEIK